MTIFGNITSPWRILSPNAYTGEQGQGLILLLNNILKTAVVVAGVWLLINVIIAGYGFMAGAGNPEQIAKAWSKIWQSLIGLLVVAGSFILAAAIGYIIFKDPMAIIQPKIFGPSST